MRFSIVIPTFNRKEKLKACIRAIEEQEFDKKQFETIVVDDGSNDGTFEMLKKIQRKAKIQLKIFSQENKGQGVARNIGIDAAEGEIILLIGDDIIATHQLLREHDRLHKAHPEENSAVLGFITWHPKITVSPLMSFMERGAVLLGRFGGHQFAFDLLEGKEQADYNFFYTSNISLKSRLLKKYKFDPWFSGYGWEDIELGYRLTKEANLKLYYSSEAIAYHDHKISDEQFADRMRQIGRSTHIIDKKYPELHKVPSSKKQLIFNFIGRPSVLALVKFLNKNLYFYCLSKKYFMEGIKKGV